MTAHAQTSLDEPGAPDRRPRVLLPTNRHNLLEILSSGLITPAAGYNKYYSDLLARAPGRVVAVAEQVSDEICSIVSEEGEASYPVALEIDVEMLTDASVEALDVDGKPVAAPLGAVAIAAWAPAAVLPCSGIQTVHFRSENELAEHTARGYANVVGDVELRASPELFGGAPTPIIGWLEGLGQPKVDDLQDRLVGADSYAGAAAAVALALPGESEWLLDWAQAVKAKRAPKRTKASPLPSWISMLLAGGKPTSDVDEVFEAIVSTLAEERGKDSWSPAALLEAVRAALPPGLSEKVSESLTAVEAILDVKQDLRRFDPERDRAEIFGLLLFLLRPDTAELLSWPAAETGADGAIAVTAAAYSGLWHGYKRLPGDFKPAGLHRLLAERTAARLDCPDALSDWTPPKFSAVESDAPERSVGLKAGRTVMFERPKASVDATHALLTRPLEEIESVALEVCRLLDWQDCAYSVVRAKSSRVRGEAVAGEPGVEITLRGFVTPEYTLDLKRFRERLAAEGLGGAEAAAAELLEA